MLDNERYNFALKAGRKFHETHWGPHEKVHPLLFDQQFMTQVALERLGVNPLTKPNDIPKINTLLGIKDNGPAKPIMISVIGMPNTLKTSGILKTRKDSDTKVAVFPERYAEAKKQLDASGQFTFDQLIEVVSDLQAKDLHDAQINAYRSKNRQLVTIFDRDWWDLPMGRAHFLSGRLDPQSLQSVESNFRKTLASLQDRFRLFLVIGIIRPELSLARDGKREKPGRIMQMPFLQNLYEQYLRFYYELGRIHQFYGQKTFSYAAVDSTEINNQSLSTILRMLFPNTQPHNIFSARIY